MITYEATLAYAKKIRNDYTDLHLLLNFDTFISEGEYEYPYTQIRALERKLIVMDYERVHGHPFEALLLEQECIWQDSYLADQSCDASDYGYEAEMHMEQRATRTALSALCAIRNRQEKVAEKILEDLSAWYAYPTKLWDLYNMAFVEKSAPQQPVDMCGVLTLDTPKLTRQQEFDPFCDEFDPFLEDED